ncbi:MAG TPA: prephenate dehydrogenase [Candidatus Omnitrophota bacterium]|nr:prephenate dehydrogenase [Candidatus Omnitrophota bacterium]
MFKKIAIIGLGLMGGSLAAACREKLPKTRIVGITRNRKALSFAKKNKWIHEGSRELRSGVQDADLIVLCTPVDTFPCYLKEIDRFCKKGTLVTDVGSVKASIQKEVHKRHWRHLSFVSCHPMVGSHERGIRVSHPALYDDGLMILVRDKRTCLRSYKKVKQFWSRFSGRIVELSPNMHDKLVGEVSHLPHAIAVCLMHTVSKPALKLASAGFRDTTRIAASDPSIWEPIFKANQKFILQDLNRFERTLKIFKRNLSASNPYPLVRFLDRAKKIRCSI